jgi:hypothetical protein
MKKTVLMIFVFATLLFVQLSPTAAWMVPTHYEIVESTYYALPADVQSKLSLDVMKDGVGDPDLKFIDFKYHKYPGNQVKVDYWLNRGKTDYKSGKYHDASYSFGVASHYISDGCSAPHCEDSASHYFHTIYELNALLLTPQINSSKGNIDNILTNDDLNGKVSWNSWIKKKNDLFIQKDLNRADSATYTAIKECVT